MAGEAAVIQAGGGGGGGLADKVPGGTRTLVIGGAALAALALVVVTRGMGGGASGADTADPAGDGRLDPSENIALGQVAYEQRAAAGEASIRDAAIMDVLSGLESNIGTGFGSLAGLVSGAESRTGNRILEAESRVQSGLLSSESRLGGRIMEAESRVQSGLLSSESRTGNRILEAESRVQSGLSSTESRLRAAGVGAPPPYSLDSGRAGGWLSTADVAREPSVRGV